jgi:hypothetical protein
VGLYIQYCITFTPLYIFYFMCWRRCKKYYKF